MTKAAADRWGPLLIVCLSVLAPAFGQDDAALFNYFNNVVSTRPIFYYLDYVPLLPELVAYLLRFAPFVLQALLYRALPIVVMLILYREWRLLLGRDGDARDAALLTLSAMLILRSVEVNIWANLMMVITPMFITAVIHAIRMGREARSYTAISMALMLIAAISVPFGVLLAPVLLLQVPGEHDRVRRTQNLGLGIAVIVGYLLLNTRFLGISVVARSPLEIASLFRNGLTTEYRLYNVIAFVSAIVLSGALVQAWRARRQDSLITILLSGVGLVSIAGVLVSDRLPFNDGGFGGAHVLPALCAMLIVASRAILAIGDGVRRSTLVGLFCGVAMLSIGGDLYHHLRGPAEIALLKYEFLRTGQAYRAACQDDGGLSFEDSDNAAVVLCRPRAFPIGFHVQPSLTPAFGENDDGASSTERPFIYVGRPVF
jgi:hypothetical protein